MDLRVKSANSGLGFRHLFRATPDLERLQAGLHFSNSDFRFTPPPKLRHLELTGRYSSCFAAQFSNHTVLETVEVDANGGDEPISGYSGTGPSHFPLQNLRLDIEYPHGALRCALISFLSTTHHRNCHNRRGDAKRRNERHLAPRGTHSHFGPLADPFSDVAGTGRWFAEQPSPDRARGLVV